MFKDRPAVGFCAVFFIAVAGFSYAPLWLKITAALAVGIIAFGVALLLHLKYLFIVRKKALSVAAAVSVAVMLAAAVTGIYYDGVMAKKAAYADGGSHIITAYAEDIVSDQVFGTTYRGVITSIDGRRVNIRATVVTDVSIGDKTYTEASFLATLHPIGEYEYGSSGYAPYQDGFVLFALMNSGGEEDGDGNVISEPVPYTELGKVRNLTSLMRAMNDAFENELYSRLDKSGHALSSALLLGRREFLPQTTARDFKTLGISHLLALSGLHLSILMGILSELLILGRVPRRVREVILICAVIFFAALTGFSPSVLRAGIMFILFYAGSLLQRESDSITSLFLAGGLIVLFNPAEVFGVSLQLSFFSTLGLLTLGQKWQLKVDKGDRFYIKPLKRLSNAVTITLSAMIFTLPFMWLYFGQTSLISPISNLIFIPLSGVILFFSPFVLMFGRIPFVGDFLAWTVNTAARWTLSMSDNARHFLWAVVSLKYSFVKFLIPPFVAGVAAVLIIYPKRRKWLYALPIASFVLIFALSIGVWSVVNHADADFIYVRSGVNEMAVIASGGEVTLVDVGNGGGSALYESRNAVRDLLCRTNVENLVLTHLHKNHNSLLWTLSQSEYLKRIIVPEPISVTDRDILQRLSDSAELLGIEIMIYPHDNQDGIIHLGKSVLRINEYGRLSRSAHPAVSFTLTAGGDGVVWIGASAAERYDAFPTNGFGRGYYIFGTHGPIYKKEIPTELLNFDLTAYVGSEKIDEYIPDGFAKRYIFVKDGGMVWIKL